MDWKKLLAELAAAGVSQKEIGKQSTISDLATGRSREPVHSLGEHILKLHAKYVRKSRKRHDRRITDQGES